MELPQGIRLFTGKDGNLWEQSVGKKPKMIGTPYRGTMQTYMDATFQPDDTLEQKQAKLYLQVISVGEQLYSAGSAVAEMQKTLNRLEPIVAQFRRDLAALKAEARGGL